MSRILHRRSVRNGAATVVAVLAALTIFTLPFARSAVAAITPAAAKTQGTPSATHTVTLITGDVVRLMDLGGGKQAADVTRPADATGGVRAETIGHDLYVLPDEVMPYLAADQLDRRLFNVSALVRQGYDDEHSDGIPLIVTYTAATQPAQAKVPDGAVKLRTLASVRGAAVKATKLNARKVWRSATPKATGPTKASTKPLLGQGMAKIWLDGKVKANLADSTAQVGAPAAWAAGYDGAGVTVAVLDTGADLNHPDLAGRVSRTASFVPGETVDDGNGHGTHTLSTVGGSGAASGGVEKGVAPKADLIVGKVLGNDGFGDDSWIISGMEWAVAQHAKVISMSLGGSEPSDGTDPMSAAVNQLSASSGALFVIAAGNSGAEATVSPPGAADRALTVAAVDHDDQLAWFSSQGPRFGDYGLKPDLAAPGVDISAAKAGGTADTGYYETLSGTSMATPHVAGAAAILAQEHPQWTGPQLKAALMSTSKQLDNTTAYQVGAGRLDVAAAVQATVTATGSVYFGFDSWPHDSEAPVDRVVTYTNEGSAPVTLNLSESASVAGGPYDVDPTADAGTPAPDGMFTLSASQVTVAAHGSTNVTVTANPAQGTNGRRYLGQITASGGTNTTRTQFGLYKEDERYTFNLTVKDRDGKPASGYVELQAFGEYEPLYFFVDESGQLTARLRANTYSAVMFLDVPGSHGADSTGVALLGDPEISLTKDVSITLDARQAREATAVVPRRTEDRMLYLDWHRSDGGISTVEIQYLLPAVADSMFVLPTKSVHTGTFEYMSRWRKAYPLLTLTDRGKELNVIGQPGSNYYDGKGNLDAVYAGTGTPAELATAKVKGKIALVTRSDGLTGSERAQAAAAAGAALLIVVNDQPGKLLEWVGQDDGSRSAVPVASLTLAQGGPLIERIRTKLGVEGVPNSPYVYDLVDPHAGRVPADLTYEPKPSELATVQMQFHGTTPYPSGEFRWDYRPYRTVSFGLLQAIDMPGTRTDYVSAQPGTAWAEDMLTGPTLNLESRTGIHTYTAGRSTVSDWYAPIAHPRNGTGFWWSDRQQGYAEFNIQPWTDNGTDHGGYMSEGETIAFDVYQDGALVASGPWASASIYPVPDQAVTFQLDLRASRDPLYRLSTRTHSEWTVVSPKVSDPLAMDTMALLQLDYRVDTNLAGDARGGRQTVGLSASHLPGAVGGGRIQDATFAVSYDDGQTWRPVTLIKNDAGAWTAQFDAPQSGFVSVRAKAWDDQGNSITQEVIRAYGLT